MEHHGLQCLPDSVQGCILHYASQGNEDLQLSFPDRQPHCLSFYLSTVMLCTRPFRPEPWLEKNRWSITTALIELIESIGLCPVSHLHSQAILISAKHKSACSSCRRNKKISLLGFQRVPLEKKNHDSVFSSPGCASSAWEGPSGPSRWKCCEEVNGVQAGTARLPWDWGFIHQLVIIFI